MQPLLTCMTLTKRVFGVLTLKTKKAIHHFLFEILTFRSSPDSDRSVSLQEGHNCRVIFENLFANDNAPHVARQRRHLLVLLGVVHLLLGEEHHLPLAPPELAGGLVSLLDTEVPGHVCDGVVHLPRPQQLGEVGHDAQGGEGGVDAGVPEDLGRPHPVIVEVVLASETLTTAGDVGDGVIGSPAHVTRHIHPLDQTVRVPPLDSETKQDKLKKTIAFPSIQCEC